MNSWKGKAGWSATIFALPLAVFALIATPSAGGQDKAFNYGDKATLTEQFSGGTFISDRIYQRCEAGVFVRYYPDGKRLPGFGTCWK